jgi:hypothetical protein
MIKQNSSILKAILSTEELKMFARLTGHDDVHTHSVDDLMICNSEVSHHMKIEHV